MGTTPTIIRNITDAGVWQKYPTTNWNNVDRSSIFGAGGSQEARVMYFFALPFNKGATLLSAQLQLKQIQATAGSVTMTITRMAASWPASRVTWNTQPGVTGTAVTLTKSSPAAGTIWTFDLKSMLQTVSNGAAWYGIRIASNGATNTQFWSPQAADPNNRPTVTFTWADNPQTPTMLYPSGGRSVGDPSPTLRCNFTDVSGDTTMAGMNVQINAGSNNFTAPTFDSGTVVTSVPELALIQTAWPGMVEGTVYWWRARVQDGAGLWSGWSVPTSMQLKYLPKVLLNNPAWSSGTPTVADATPPFDWSIVSRTNLATNPDFASNNTTGWTQARGTIATVTENSPSGTIAGRYTSNDATTVSGNYLINQLAAASAGIVYTGYTWVKPQTSGYYYAELQFMNATPTQINLAVGTPVWCDASVWTRVPVTGAGGSGTTQVRINVHASAALAVGAYFDWDATMLETGDEVLPFFSGTTVGAGRPQRAYAVTVTTADINDYRIWTTGKVTATTTVVTPPTTVLKTNNEDYKVTVQVWDDIEREAVPEAPVAAAVDRTFIFTYSASTAPATGLTATVNTIYPRVTLNWSRSAQPDKWQIYRNGVLMANITGDAAFVSGTAYTWTDNLALPRTAATYQVIAVVNNLGATSSPTVAATATMKSTTLMAKDGSYAITIFNAKKDYALSEDSTAFTPAGQGSPFLITQSEHGYQGKIQGRLASNGVQTSTQQRDAYNALRKTNGATLALAIGDECFQVFIMNATINSIVKNEEMVYDIAFDFYQTDYTP